MMILNNFPGGERKISETTLTPENARAGYSFFNASEKFVAGEIQDYSDDTVITPTTAAQLLSTSGKYVPCDITVKAIPSAYKRYAWRSQSAVTGNGTNVFTLPVSINGTQAEVEAFISNSHIFLSHFWSYSINGSSALALDPDINWLMNLYKSPGETSTVQCCYCCRVSGNSLTTYYTKTLTGCTFTWDDESGKVTVTLPANSNIVFMPALYSEAILADY